MTKYPGEKYTIDAYRIKTVAETLPNGTKLLLENNTEVIASSVLIGSRMPEAGDYWAIREDGTICLLPRREFEKKFALYPHEL